MFILFYFMLNLHSSVFLCLMLISSTFELKITPKFQNVLQYILYSDISVHLKYEEYKILGYYCCYIIVISLTLSHILLLYHLCDAWEITTLRGSISTCLLVIFLSGLPPFYQVWCLFLVLIIWVDECFGATLSFISLIWL